MLTSSALAWLALASLLGALLVARPVMVRMPALDALRPLAVHVLVMGFATQALLALLLARPRPIRAVGGTDPGLLTGACLLVLDVGISLRVVSEPMLLLRALPPWGILVFASAILEGLAAFGLVALAWPRRDAG